MAYDRNADFEELCDHLDSHVFTGDTLFDPKMIELFEDYVGRWTRAIASQKETNKEVAEQEKYNYEGYYPYVMTPHDDS